MAGADTLVAAIGAALSGASASDISQAANIAETAHRFNYLAHKDLERLKTAKAACARGNAADCAEARRLEDKDEQQQKAYLACRANGYAGAGCTAVLGDVAAALSSYSGIAPVYLGTAKWQRIVGDKDTLDQLVRIMAPEGRCWAQQAAWSYTSISTLARSRALYPSQPDFFNSLIGNWPIGRELRRRV